MSTVLGFDWDGTLVESFTATPLPGVRERLHALPAGTRTFLALNQDGPAWRLVTGDPRYPTTAGIAETIAAALGMWAINWWPDVLLICVHPGKDSPEWQQAADRVARDLRRMLPDVSRPADSGWRKTAGFPPAPRSVQRVIVSSDQDWRKPQPGMLLEAARFFQVQPAEIVYVGDTETDREAAQVAGARFIWAEAWAKGEPS